MSIMSTPNMAMRPTALAAVMVSTWRRVDPRVKTACITQSLVV